MNIVLALQQLGYNNETDFDVKFDGTDVVIDNWYHTDPQPSTAAIAQGWVDYEALPVDLSNIKLRAKYAVDLAAEKTRLKYITVGAGQAMAYMEKSEEAADFVAAGYPTDLTTYPFIQAEVNATGKTPTVAADDILNQKATWIAKGAAIEEVRLNGKKSIMDAANEGAVEVARDAAIVALEAL